MRLVRQIAFARGYVRREHGDGTVALCCSSCVAAFERDAGGYVRRQKTKKELHEIYQLLRPALPASYQPPGK